MKQRVFFLMLLAAASVANAQTEQGNFLVGGNIQLNTTENQTGAELNPSAGYFFTDDFAAGANLTFSYSKYKGLGGTSTSTVGIGPFVRYYTGSANVRPFLQGNGNFSSVKTKESGGGTRTLTGIDYFFGPGVAIFLNRNVALEGLLGYKHEAYKNQEGSGGFAFKFGFQVYLSNAQVRAVTNQ